MPDSQSSTLTRRLRFARQVRRPSHLAQVTDAEAEGLGVARAGVHEVAHQQDDLQQLGEGLALAKFLTGGRHRHHVWLQVVELLVKLELEEDGVQTWHQTLDRADLVVVEVKEERTSRDEFYFYLGFGAQGV